MKAVIIMSALVPTEGHGYLIDWAYHYTRSRKFEKLYVLVMDTPAEPIRGHQRTAALQRRFLKELDTGYLEIRNVPFDPLELPEHPDPTKEWDALFWGLWARYVQRAVGTMTSDDCYIGSEKWGATMAKVMNCEFVPCDPNREIVRVKGTGVRNSPIDNFSQILPEAQVLFRKTLTVFGAESTGKTTLAKQLAADVPGHYVHEWARPYLENTSPETTEAKMRTIAHGQLAAEQTVAAMSNKPFIFRDTDLLSTMGFYRLYYKTIPSWLERMWQPADLYLLTQSNIPFTPDILRYGGDKREAPDSFWEQLLIDYNCNYVTIKSQSHAMRRYEAEQAAHNLFMSNPVWDYVRQGNV